MKRASLALAAMLSLAVSATPLKSHCEIPCGIYDDALRAKLIDEHIGTVAKSMEQIQALSKAPPAERNYNQLVRWVSNKEAHAGEIQHIVTQYFLTQRVKPADPADAAAHKKYIAQLTLLHRMLVHAMKAKQGTDLAEVKTLRSAWAKFRSAYFGVPAKAVAGGGDHAGHHH